MSRVQEPPKKGYFMDAESVAKTLKFLTWQAQMLYWRKLPQLCILMRV